ncbi:exopolysaccharide biosynthesis protein [soil metagenome]
MPTQPNVPISVQLSRILSLAEGTHVSIGWVLEQLGPRSFGLTFFVMGLVGLVPGLSTFVGALVAWPALQLVRGRKVASLPRVVRERTISVQKLARISQAASSRLTGIERLIRPRWPPAIQATRSLTGFVMLLLGLTMALPVPFGHLVPAFVILLLALAYLEEDGIALTVGLVAALASLAITATAVWGTIETIDFLDPARRP